MLGRPQRAVHLVTLSVLLWQAVADNRPLAAVRKLPVDANEKILAEHLSFQLDSFGFEDFTTNTSTRFFPSFNTHHGDPANNAFKRALDALSLLEKRSSCPGGFEDCADIGSPNKCCRDGTYCSYVPDSETAHVACCPDGASCGGAVTSCPSDAITCPAELGGGCCIAGFVCQGVGCVPSASATPVTETETQIQSATGEGETKTVTKTQTTDIKGKPSTVIVTVIVTESSSEKPTTKTTTITKSTSHTSQSSGTSSAAGGAPYRPTMVTTGSTDADTQTGCPIGFYGCLATHGGGCCRTDRNCDVHDCPAASSTTVESNGVSVVVAATDVPASTTSTCAQGWFLCGEDAGPVAGCCPSGFDCGTASCYTVTASRTEARQKEAPTAEKDSGAPNICAGLRNSWMSIALLTTSLFMSMP